MKQKEETEIDTEMFAELIKKILEKKKAFNSNSAIHRTRERERTFAPNV